MPAIAKKRNDVEVRWVNKREFANMIDARAQRVLGISAKKFISRWKSGKYRKLDTDSCPGVIELALLAPLPRPKRASKESKSGRRNIH